MSREVPLWEALRPRFQSMGLDPHRVENALGVGTPDVNYVYGWVELKHLDRWPVRGGVVRIPSLEKRKEQVAWLLRRWVSGGMAFLLLRVGSELLLFDGWTSRDVRRGMTREALGEAAAWTSAKGTWESFGWWLTGSPEEMPAHERAKFYRLRACESVAGLASQLGVAQYQIRAGEDGSDPGMTETLLESWEC